MSDPFVEEVVASTLLGEKYGGKFLDPERVLTAEDSLMVAKGLATHIDFVTPYRYGEKGLQANPRMSRAMFWTWTGLTLLIVLASMLAHYKR